VGRGLGLLGLGLGGRVLGLGWGLLGRAFGGANLVGACYSINTIFSDQCLHLAVKSH
jgi:hypothetical protein